MIQFGNPSSVVLGGRDFSTQANDLSGGFDINPFQPGANPGFTMPEGFAGPGGFNLPGTAAQNIVTDVNHAGMGMGSSPSFGGAGLSNPAVSHSFPNMDGGLDGAC